MRIDDIVAEKMPPTETAEGNGSAAIPEGTRDAVTVSELFNAVNPFDGDPFSLGTGAIADAIIGSANRRARLPETRLKIFGKIASNVDKARRDVDKQKNAFGREVTQISPPAWGWPECGRAPASRPLDFPIRVGMT